MKNLNPIDIFNDLKRGKIDSSNAIEKLLSISRETRNDDLRIEISDILLEMYRSAKAEGNEKSERLKATIEEIIGKNYISKYNVVPSEAMALGLLELITSQEILNEDEFHEQHHVHISFRVEYGHVVNLDIVEVYCPKVLFLDLFPKLIFLTISMTDLKEIEGLNNLIYLKFLNLAGNKLTKIDGVEKLVNLEKLDLNLNKITELIFNEPLKHLEEILISFNPLVKLNGLENLNSLRYIEVEGTKLPKSAIKKIKKKLN